MNFNTSTIMMIFFITALIIGVWKIYAFLPSRRLKDDDTTKESQAELISIMLRIIKSSDKELSPQELFKRVCDDKDFDKQHYWIFNQNRLNQLLNSYYLKYPPAQSIADIYKSIK